jgi:Antitoxin FitA-like, ribbon-helix-helix/Clp amino terminal domain, pathogenicity island component
MATLHVRNVPDELYELLRERAGANARSIGAETIQLLQERLSLAGFGRPPRRFPMPGRSRRGPGTGMFTRFTTGARQAVVGAQEHAGELGHHHVGTAHLLAGVLDVTAEGPLGEQLARLGLTPKLARAELERTPSAGDEPPTGQIPFEPAAKQALELALREALKLGDEAITPEHLLLGIHGQETSSGARFLRNAEPSRDKLCQMILGSRTPLQHSPQLVPRPSFRVVLLEGDAAAWEKRLDDAAALGYDLLEIVDGRAIMRRI